MSAPCILTKFGGPEQDPSAPCDTAARGARHPARPMYRTAEPIHFANQLLRLNQGWVVSGPRFPIDTRSIHPVREFRSLGGCHLNAIAHLPSATGDVQRVWRRPVSMRQPIR